MGTRKKVVKVIYRQTIRTPSGRVVRRPNGRPFRIEIRSKS